MYFIECDGIIEGDPRQNSVLGRAELCYIKKVESFKFIIIIAEYTKSRKEPVYLTKILLGPSNIAHSLPKLRCTLGAA